MRRLISIALAAGLLAACTPQPAPSAGAISDLSGFFTCMRGKSALVGAHRGGPKPGFPENAIETMAEALRTGPMLMEVDVATSADGTLFLMHDDRLARTTTGRGETNEVTWDALSKLALEDNNGRKTPYRIPTLREALRWAKGKTVLELDIKRDTRFEDVTNMIREENAYGHALVIVYSTGAAGKIHRLDPKIMVSASVNNQRDWADLKQAGVRMNRLIAWTGIEAVRPRLNDMLRERGVSAAFGTLGGIDDEIERSGDEGRYRDLVAQGVDILASDRPEQAYRSLQRLGSTAEAWAACTGT